MLIQHLAWLMKNLLLEKGILLWGQNRCVIMSLCSNVVLNVALNIILTLCGDTLFYCKNLFKMSNLFLIIFSLVWSNDQGVHPFFFVHRSIHLAKIKNFAFSSPFAFHSLSILCQKIPRGGRSFIHGQSYVRRFLEEEEVCCYQNNHFFS